MWSNLNQIAPSIVALSAILFITGCEGCGDEKPLQQVELAPEATALEVSFRRFDRDLFQADFSKPEQASQQLYQSYGSFFCNFVESDLMLAPCKSDSLGMMLAPFVNNPDIRQTHEEIEKVFTPKKMDSITSTLTEAVRRWHHFFPDSLVPHIVFYQSAWNNNIATVDSTLGIALDCYLGEKNRLIQKLHPEMFPGYKKANMDAEFLVPDAAKGWVARQARYYYAQGDFLNELIFYGKLMYLAEALVPGINDAQMMNWSEEELAWAEKNEWSTWKQMANEKVMFMTRRFEINKWFADAPFTNAAAIPQDSPPQLGVWMGWKIVRQFMEANPDFTPQQLLQEKDNNRILSAFKPQRES